MSRHLRPGLVLAGALAAALPAGRAIGQDQDQHPAPARRAGPAGTHEQALAALKEMSGVLASARTMRFKTRSLVPVKLSDRWVTMVGMASVMREGNDKLHVETGGDLFPFQLIFDGKTITAFAPKDNVFAQEEAPGTIDQALTRAAKRGEASFAFADLVSSDPYTAMTKGMRNAVVVGTSTVEGVETEHLAVHGQQVDWEVWIGTKDHLPRMVTLTDNTETRKPTHTVLLSEWAIGEPIPADAFTFSKPADATRVPFRNPREVAAAGAHRGGGQP